MTSENDVANKFDELRRQAKELIRHRTHPAPETPFDIFELIHELQIHQAEIEIQNEELQRAQHELAELHAEYEALYELAPCGYVTLDRNGLINRANRAATELIGTKRAYLMHCHFGSFIVREWQDAFLHAAQEAGRSGEKRSLELPLQRLRETPLWVRADIEADLDEQDVVEQWRVVLVDISERKLLEAKQDEYREQELQAKKMASIGRLAGGVAHEFNNLLQGMLGNVELLQMKKPVDDPDNRYLQQLCSHIFRAKEIVEALLTMSSKSLMNLQSIDLNVVVTETLNVLKRSAPCHISLAERLSPDPLLLEADAALISQAITHLMENAFDAIPDDRAGRIEIRTERGRTSFAAPWRSGEEPSVMIHIDDTGEGMSEEIQKEVFDPFFTTKEIGEGTGLGLSSVYSIVHLHGGKVTMSSQTGRGSRFTLHFPERRSKVGHEAPLESKASESPASEPGNATVLLVEDEDDIREVLSEFLKLQGFTVIEAKEGESAYRVFQDNQRHIDLVVLDLGIPGIDGEAFIDRVKQLQADAKIIVASGYTQHRMASDPEGFGVSAFLGKPFNLQAALHTIQAALSRE